MLKRTRLMNLKVQPLDPLMIDAIADFRGVVFDQFNWIEGILMDPPHLFGHFGIILVKGLKVPKHQTASGTRHHNDGRLIPL